MRNLLSNTLKLLSTAGMPSAYCRWKFNHLFWGKSPVLVYENGTRIENWLNFSEYWSFRDGIPKSEQLFIARYLSSRQAEKKIAFDIGANIGIFTLNMANIPSTEVHSFEPIKLTFRRLEENVKINLLAEESVFLNCSALGFKSEEIEFKVYEQIPAINRLSLNTNYDSLSSGSKLERVMVTSLDNYCDVHNIQRIHFLKVDVEGMEVQVLKGASKFLEGKLIDSILLEVCPNNLLATGNSVDSLYKAILDTGYFPYRILANGNIGKRLSLAELEDIILENVAVLPA